MTTEIEGCRVCSLVHGREPELLVGESRRWVVASLPGPVPIPGWVMLCARDHVRGPGYLDDEAAASYGVVLRHLARIVERETGALRVYTAALAEADPHFHTHLVPRYRDLPLGKKGFAMFELQRLAIEGSLPVDSAANEAMLEKIRRALASDPLPG